MLWQYTQLFIKFQSLVCWWQYIHQFINCQSGICRLQRRGKGSLSSWSLALRAGVLRRAVSHTARPMLCNAISSFTVGRSTSTTCEASPPERFGNPDSKGSCLTLIRGRSGHSNSNGSFPSPVWFQSSRAVRPNRSLNRTLCGGPGLGL